jgi:hypothetical protein
MPATRKTQQHLHLNNQPNHHNTLKHTPSATHNTDTSLYNVLVALSLFVIIALNGKNVKTTKYGIIKITRPEKSKNLTQITHVSRKIICRWATFRRKVASAPTKGSPINFKQNHPVG